MSERKPMGMSFTSWIDAQVKEARSRGEFDDLPGKGKPLEGLGERDPDWWLRNMMKREGISWLPPTIEIRRDVEKFHEELASFPSERMVLLKVKKLNERIREANSGNMKGPMSTVSPLNPGKVLARWRKSR